MADDEAHGMAVGGDEILHPLLEFGIVEGFRGQVERVVVLGCVECLAHGIRVFLRLVLLILQALLGRIHGQHRRLHGVHVFDHAGHQRHQLRHQGVEALHKGHQAFDVVGHRVDAVEGVEDGPDRPAHRDVEAVLLPVEVTTERPPGVLEIRYMVPQVFDVESHALHLHDHAVGGFGHLLGQARHLRHAVDGRLHHVGLFEHVGHLVFLILLVHLLGDALHADLKGN